MLNVELGEGCVHMYKNDGTWNDDTCGGQRSFVCEGTQKG